MDLRVEDKAFSVSALASGLPELDMAEFLASITFSKVDCS